MVNPIGKSRLVLINLHKNALQQRVSNVHILIDAYLVDGQSETK